MNIGYLYIYDIIMEQLWSRKSEMKNAFLSMLVIIPCALTAMEPRSLSTEEKTQQRQYQLMCAFNGDSKLATFDNYAWIRHVESRSTGRTIVLEPCENNPHNGPLLKKIITIQRNNKKYCENARYEPSERVACTIGLAMVAGITYWCYQAYSKSE